MGTLRELIDDDVTAVFLETDDFAQSVEHYRGANQEIAETITVVFDRDGLDDKQGSRVNDDRGLRIKQTALLECSANVEIDEEKPGGQYPSLFIIGGESWLAKRIVGKDDAMQTVEVVRTERKVTRRIGER